MLKIKKSLKGGVVLYDDCNFAYHTHLKDIHIAYQVRKNVENRRIPRTKSLWLLYSHLRVAKHEGYRIQLKKKIAEINEYKNNLML